MKVRETIMADIKSAMKNKEAERLSALRLLSSAIKNKEIENRPKELTDNDVISVIKKSIKQRKDSIEQYGKANRQDLVDKEKTELLVLEVYLPEQMSKEQVVLIVEEVIASTGAQTMKDMGKVMGLVSKKTEGNADNSIVSELVKTRLQ